MTDIIPAWLEKRQVTAKKRYEELPVPKRNDEEWRFANVKQLDFENLEPQTIEVDREELVSRSKGLEQPVAKLIFLDEELVSTEGNLPEGVICLSFAQALQQHPDLVEEHFMKQETRLGSLKYATLHEASVTNGIFVYVPKNVTVEGTIEVHHWVSGNKIIFPHTLVITEESAKVRLVDLYRSVDETSPGIAIGYKDLYAGKNSSLDYIAIQDLNEFTRMISIKETSTDRDARTKAFILNTGASWARNESMSRLEGPNAHSDMLSVSIPDHEQEYDQRTFQHHVSEGAYSDLLYKNTLYGHSRSVFSGLIFVDEKAHHTDAYQTCRNLLMTDDCEAHSMPGLEINADQVKCSHGSTAARISDDEIFYLQARGIDPVSARQLIARGFSIEAIERLENDEVEALILKFVDAKFARIGTI
ncbi:MAG: SufD family Fe-S cluster assembly protein [Akkermansiaceae bacterium]